MEGTARERFQFNYRVNTKNARIGFATEGSGAWKVWDRFLTVDGNKVFHIGNICDTCNFFFEKLEDSTPLCASEISECLNNNKDLFSKEFLNSVAALLPADDYVVAHVDLLPRLVEFGKEGDYFSEDCKHFFRSRSIRNQRSQNCLLPLP